MTYHISKNIGLVDDKNIKGFFEDYRWASNFYEREDRVEIMVTYKDVGYYSTEAAYQAAKCLNEEDKEKFRLISASKSKRLGRKVPIRKDWDEVKEQIMYEIVYCKFIQNEDLKKKLIETGNKYLEETNWWNDIFWGCDEKGRGLNKLGHILMRVRNEIKNLKIK